MKKIIVLITLLCAKSTVFSQFAQIGQDIDGIAGDQSGYSVSLNYSGNRIAIGGPFNSTTGNMFGVVRVYEFNGVSWVQMGQNIYGTSFQENLGNSVAINNAGNRVVIGSVGADPLGGSGDGIVQVFEFDGTNWNLLGQPIVGENPSDRFGFSVDINGVGDRIIAGAMSSYDGGANAGSARVYDYDGVNWVQVGQDMDGAFSENSGSAVSIDPGGSVVAMGGPNNSNGVVRVYYFDGANWIQIGADINGDTNGDKFGTSLCLSNDGGKLVVGAPTGGFASQGSVTVYTYNGGNWTPFGQTILGTSNGDHIGGREAVTIDPFGSKLLIGSRFNDGNGNSSGNARLFTFDGSSWVLGGFINGESAGDEMGQVSLSDNGQRIALGARENTGAGSIAGHARVYELGNVGVGEVSSTETFVIYPNPSNGVVNIKSSTLLSVVEIFDLSGRYIDSYEFNNQLHLRQDKGVYLLKLMFNEVCLGTLRIEIL